MLKTLFLAGALGLAASAALAQTATQPATPARPAAPPAATAPATPARPAAPAAAPAATTPASALIDINSASEAELRVLNGIGEARAAAIIRGRPYRGKDDLVNRNIIPQGVYDGIKDRIIARQR
ncbi:helix-hairpin-helix domain-containing protein [Phreatobacter aquaticus]|uniref:Helix-hairpin-helix domain-containing protein n=1 Tax=Phreatobacter aquaticus TaxID=2570229 RepID=A0A4D7QDP2_9HYPH|nr:helix-hairpin-helix domain-containing protein [Phreatobacter aquaticus]QCK84785.1 helix-hairpin-helix domain-containing protein [Phreatobacter aquaticus]